MSQNLKPVLNYCEKSGHKSGECESVNEAKEHWLMLAKKSSISAELEANIGHENAVAIEPVLVVHVNIKPRFPIKKLTHY